MNQETDTPRSAKCAYQARQQTIGKWIVPYAKAQELEIELNAAKEVAKYYADLARENGIKASIAENALTKEREWMHKNYSELRELAKQITKIVK